MNYKYKLEIELGNEAMLSGADVADALRAVADRIDVDQPMIEQHNYGISDRNGNRVGTWSVV